MGRKGIAILLAGVMLASCGLTGCGDTQMDKEAVALTVGDTEVSLGFLNFVARYEQAQRDPYYVTYLGENVWESDSDGDGLTTEETTKADIMQMIQEWFVLEDMQAEYDVVVPDTTMTSIQETAAAFMADNTSEAIEQLGATQEYVEQMLYYVVLESLMQAAIEAEATVTVTDEDAAMRTFSYIMLSGLGGNNENGVYEKYEGDKLEEVKAEAQKAVDRAKKDFDAVAAEYKYEGTDYSYGSNDEVMDDALIAAADALKEGEVSGLVEGANGYFVVRLDSEYDEVASGQNKLSLMAAQRQEYYLEVLADALEAADIKLDEKLWAQVKFDSLFTIKTEDATTTE